MASRRYRYRSRSLGSEYARRHIEQARRLSEELGGADQDVKDYFFALPYRELHAILNEYERRHGSAAREYAQRTISRWRSGRVTMSGMVASRLFSLLPPRMPLAAKYKLTENVWRHVGPSSRKTLRVGLDANLDDVMAKVHEHIEAVVVNYKIPASLERRFDWLSAGDVHVKQDLLNHLRQMEKLLVMDGARAQLPAMLVHLRSDDGRYTHRLAHILQIGKHELELLIDKGASGVRLENPSLLARAGDQALSGGSFEWWWFWVVIGLLIVGLVVAQ